MFPHLTSFHSFGPNGRPTEHSALCTLKKNKTFSIPSLLLISSQWCCWLTNSHLCVFLMWLSIPPSLSPEAFIPCSEICRETYPFLVVLFVALAYSILCFIHSPPRYTHELPQDKIRFTSTARPLEQQRSLPSHLQGLRRFPCTALCFPMGSCIREANQHRRPGLSFDSLCQWHEIVAPWNRELVSFCAAEVLWVYLAVV